jgi:hypothetical protein
LTGVGRCELAARFLYTALELDPYEARALGALAELLDDEGTEGFAALVLEYGLSPDRPISLASREALEAVRRRLRWRWGLAIENGGAERLESEAFEDASRFTVDEAATLAFVEGAKPPGISIEAGFRAAHLLAGTMGGLVTHFTRGQKAELDELFHPERFIETKLRLKWLASELGER